MTTEQPQRTENFFESQDSRGHGDRLHTTLGFALGMSVIRVEITGQEPPDCAEGLRRFFRDRVKPLSARVTGVPRLRDRG